MLIEPSGLASETKLCENNDDDKEAVTDIIVENEINDTLDTEHDNSTDTENSKVECNDRVDTSIESSETVDIADLEPVHFIAAVSDGDSLVNDIPLCNGIEQKQEFSQENFVSSGKYDFQEYRASNLRKVFMHLPDENDQNLKN